MKKSVVLTIVVVLSALLGTAAASAADLKALVGGTLIDGFGSHPLRNSVVLIDGERITAIGTVHALVRHETDVRPSAPEAGECYATIVASR